MARRLKSTKIQTDSLYGEKRATTKDHGDGRVSGVDLPSRRLIYIDVDHPLWRTRHAGGKPDAEAGVWKFAIVWVRAPHDADDGDDRRLRDELMACGALKVKVLPREQSPITLPERAGQEGDPTELDASEETRGSMRNTAEAMAREVATGVDQKWLLEALDEALTEAGL